MRVQFNRLPELDMDAFVKALRKLRTERGISQARLAELLGVTPRVYNRWERGNATPRLDTVVRIADALQVSLDELTGREQNGDRELRLRDPKLHSLYMEIDKLSDEDQHALAILLDSLIKRSQMGKLLAG